MYFKVHTKNNDEVYLGVVKPVNEIDLTNIEDSGWFFNWKKEFYNPLRHVYKLIINGTMRYKA